jgi:hypothetical protein
LLAGNICIVLRRILYKNPEISLELLFTNEKFGYIITYCSRILPKILDFIYCGLVAIRKGSCCLAPRWRQYWDGDRPPSPKGRGSYAE